MEINSLYKKARDGDDKSKKLLFERLYVSFRLFVQRRVMNRHDAEEIIQDAMKTIAQKFTDIDLQTNFAAWAYTVLKNKLMDYYKMRHLHQEKQRQIREESRINGSLEADPVLIIKLKECLKKIGHRHPGYLRILNLYYQGYSTEEICRRLKISSNNFYVTLYRVRSMLEKCLEEGDI